jgi:glycosyltransferase involved in cell wall biosynthesis
VSRANPPVAIGIPVYNGERYLGAALASLLDQTFSDFELVIGDNASTDATREIALAAASQDSRVRYLETSENRGAAWNFNRVFHATTARYFRWAAHDDLVAPTHLERLVEALDDASPGTVLAQSLTTFIDADGRTTGNWDEGFDASGERASQRLSQLVRHLIKANILFGLVRRSALERTRMHGAYLSADYVLLSELALLGKFVVVPERLFFRRIHPEMSRMAHPDLRSISDWYKPGAGRTARPEAMHLFVEHIRAIAHSPLGVSERAEVLAVFLPAWFARYKRRMARELHVAIGGLLRPRAG